MRLENDQSGGHLPNKKRIATSSATFSPPHLFIGHKAIAKDNFRRKYKMKICSKKDIKIATGIMAAS
ncbi:MAG: hypothetical protein K6E12_01090, partial [Saccharofermentans sp.]|nr:hypothetical protein [Saccharofermentans sp.]